MEIKKKRKGKKKTYGCIDKKILLPPSLLAFPFDE